MDNYDVIIVGAGNGGLATAATLTRKKLKTLIIEKNMVPGGAATSFRRGRFEFEASLHEMAGVGTVETPGSVRKLFDKWGVKINWLKDDYLFRVITDEYDVVMPAGIEAFCEAMEKEVPGSYASVKTMFEYIKKINGSLEYLASGKVDPQVLTTEHADFLRMASYSVDDCLKAFGMPEKAQNIIKTYWPYLGTPTNVIDFAHYAMMFISYVECYPHFPAYTSHELSSAIAQKIVDNGGEIWYNSEVEEILVKDGKAYGVMVNGKEIHANYIVANCMPDLVYGKLIKKEVPEKALKLVNSRQTPSLFFTVYLGLNKSHQELGIDDYSVFIMNSSDAKKQYESCDNIDTSFIIANCINKAIPNASDPGTTIMTFTTIFNENAWEGIKVEDYKKVKNRVAERLIRVYEEKLGVELSPYIEELVISAPPTFARYLNTPNGTPYGYMMLDFDTMINRMMNARNEQFIERLYFTGASAERSLGYSSTYANGDAVGKRILMEVMMNARS